MKNKITKAIVVISMALTTLSLLFFIGLMYYNVKRLILVSDASVLAVIISAILVLIGIVLLVSISVISFIPFVLKKKTEHKQYMSLLYLFIVYKLITYVLFSIIDYSLPNEVTGILGGVNYTSYILVYRTDLLPLNIFATPTVGFIHSLMYTDFVSIGLVVLGFMLYRKDKYAPLIAATLSIIITIMFITYINVYTINDIGLEFLYYKADAVFTTLIVEFAMLGYVIQYVFGKNIK